MPAPLSTGVYKITLNAPDAFLNTGSDSPKIGDTVVVGTGSGNELWRIEQWTEVTNEVVAIKPYLNDSIFMYNPPGSNHVGFTESPFVWTMTPISDTNNMWEIGPLVQYGTLAIELTSEHNEALVINELVERNSVQIWELNID